MRNKLKSYLCLFALIFSQSAASETIDTDLLIVGGTESGCAAAVQAARMGVESIVLVNDIEWLGGQFSAEALAAIDENANTVGSGGYGIRHNLPIARDGLFKEVITRIEARNERKYGVARPGNTRVITTTPPADAAEVFEELLQPYVDRGQLQIIRNHFPVDVNTAGDRVESVKFESTENGDNLTVDAKLTIDASDWGDVIRLSGAAYEFGPDLKSKYGEPEAPESREDYPLTDMNPITYTLVIEETDEEQIIPKPPHYDPWAYEASPWPRTHDYFYASRRIIDSYGFEDVTRSDMILFCTPHQDYPLDTYPNHVAEALEATEKGASRKNIVDMTREQRQIIFQDAKEHSLGLLYWLQTVLHDQLEEGERSFRYFRLSDQFGTEDKLPFKPYVRESLQLKAMHMMRQQHTLGAEGDSLNFAEVMYYDGLACWQFEYDYHPTRREFRDGDTSAPWIAAFRPLRNWGPPYSGRALVPMRSLVPERIDGLLGAQKNLGYSSIVSSAVRLHDQSMAVGQAAGATAAVALLNGVAPRAIPGDAELLEKTRAALCSREHGATPAMLWPFRDMETEHPDFVAINRLAAMRILPITKQDIDFRPDEAAAEDWRTKIVERTAVVKGEPLSDAPAGEMTRGEFVTAWLERIDDLSNKPFERKKSDDADADGIADNGGPMPYGHDSLLPIESKQKERYDISLPAEIEDIAAEARIFNFAGSDAPALEGVEHDAGRLFDNQRGYGWTEDMTANHRRRGINRDIKYDTFIYARDTAEWECAVQNGLYYVTMSIGDAGYEQPGQFVEVEDVVLADVIDTAIGEHHIASTRVQVQDGRLTLVMGTLDTSKNTCLNWLRLVRLDP